MTLRFCLICIFLCGTFLTKAEAGEDPEGWLRRGDSLLQKGAYFEAGIAYERVLFEIGDNGGEAGDKKLLLAAVMGKTQCMKQQGLFDQAVRFLEGWQVQPFADSSLAELHYQQILCNYLGGHYEGVLSLVERWPYLHPARSLPSLAAVLRVVSLNGLQRWNEAAGYYHELVQHASVPDLYVKLPHLKDTMKAAWLSTFIPGAGQWYAGRPAEGIVSLLVQAAGIYFAVLSFEQHYYVSGLFVGAVLFASFHSGGVRRAEVLVRQYNGKQIAIFNEKVRDQLLMVITSAGKGVR